MAPRNVWQIFFFFDIFETQCCHDGFIKVFDHHKGYCTLTRQKQQMLAPIGTRYPKMDTLPKIEL